VNPPVRLAWRLGFGPPGDALLETIGRRIGRMQRTPICDGQEGDTFWLIVQHGRRSDYVRNIEANPHVRVRTGSAWAGEPEWHMFSTTTRSSECEFWGKAILGVDSAWAPPRRSARTFSRFALTLILFESRCEGQSIVHVQACDMRAD
jgi:deazaflavin-dependent oxidoreductase (nitroreductase family)